MNKDKPEEAPSEKPPKAPELIEGKEAFRRFEALAKRIVRVRRRAQKRPSAGSL